MLLSASAAGQSDDISTWFQQLDTNSDGQLSADELKKAAPEALQQRLKGADKDGDGVLTQAQVQAHFDQPTAIPKGPAPAD
jgi:Ca2+-binding EF-hand superfamily protein